jgi:hypothetical protein
MHIHSTHSSNVCTYLDGSLQCIIDAFRAELHHRAVAPLLHFGQVLVYFLRKAAKQSFSTAIVTCVTVRDKPFLSLTESDGRISCRGNWSPSWPEKEATAPELLSAHNRMAPCRKIYKNGYRHVLNVIKCTSNVIKLN